MARSEEQRSGGPILVLAGIALLLAFALTVQLAAPCAFYRVRVALTVSGFSWGDTTCAPWPDGCVCQTSTRPEWLLVQEGKEPETMPPKMTPIQVEVEF